MACKIHITTHEGKMEGIPSISTSTILNPNCRRNAKIKGSICEKCYAKALLMMRPGLNDCMVENTKILTSCVLPDDELPDTTGVDIFRFESFGDICNIIQLSNYINIAKKNPNTRFTLWTKQYGIAYDYFAENDVPDNFTLILSSLMMNTKYNITRFLRLNKFKEGQLKVFTVYDKEYISEHPTEVNINCGSRSCMGCRKCYDRTKDIYINEVLKSDQEAAYDILRSHDSKSQEDATKVLTDLDSLLGF